MNIQNEGQYYCLTADQQTNGLTDRQRNIISTDKQTKSPMDQLTDIYILQLKNILPNIIMDRQMN